jgi:2-keto-4-pentenoate hydratase
MSDAATQFADLIIAARRDLSKRLADVPVALRPTSVEAAYVVQHKVAATFGEIGGWKVGAPGGNRVCGALPASGVKPSPATLSAAVNPYRGIEAEVAFRMASDLPPRATLYSRAEVVAAIGTMHPAIEVLETRFLDPDALDLLTNLADTQSHGGFIFGPGTLNWQGIDLATMHCEQHVDGKLSKDKTGYPFGDILDMMEWLANVGAVWAGGLKAGQFVTCGSWTGKECVPASANVRVSFTSLGEVLLRYVA